MHHQNTNSGFNVGGEKLRIAGVGGAATFTSSVTATGFFNHQIYV
jgi:hypothetical protein